MDFDVVIAGGGPAGLSAALTLARGGKRVLLADRGPRRNARAVQMHNFVTRDGTPPDEFRAVAHAQLAQYPAVQRRDAAVSALRGEKGAFELQIGDESVRARRLLLATGMLDVLPELPGLPELWGYSAFQCPYCHGWEARGGRWGYLALPHTHDHLLPFALQMRGWTEHAHVFLAGDTQPAAETLERLERAGVAVHRARVRALHRAQAPQPTLAEVELQDGARVALDTLFVHPRQRQVPWVAELGLACDAAGYLQLDPATGQSSRPGVHAAGDLGSPMQSAIFAAAQAVRVAAALNLELTLEHAPA